MDGINRTNDYAFKRIFGSEEGKEPLCDLLNAVFSASSSAELAELEFIDREIDPKYYLDKGARLDILAKTADGTLVNVEVQIAKQTDIDKRTLFYWAKLYGGQLKSGHRFSELRRTVTVNILKFDWFADERYHHAFRIRDVETGETLNDDLEIHFLELNKVLKREWDVDNRLEAWMMYLNNLEGGGLQVLAEKYPAIKKAMTIEEVFKRSDLERYIYELREKAIHDEASMLAGAEEKGRQESRQDDIIRYLKKKFKVDCADKIRQVKEIEVLDKLFDDLIDAETPDEAVEIVNRV